MKTTTLKPPAPLWYVVDAAGLIPGRVAAKVAKVLRGKHRPSFSPHQLCGDHVIILNAAQLNVTPAKAIRKTYFRHSGYLGHSQTRTLKQMMEKSPEKVLEIAIKGMLPANRLRPKMLKRLHVFAAGEHTFQAQKPQPLDLTHL